MISQVELEKQTYEFGQARANRLMANNEGAGRANNNPYAGAIMRRFVLPLAERISEDLSSKKPGRNQAHVTLLAPLDPEAVAYLAVRNALNILMGSSAIAADTPRSQEHAGERRLSNTIGKAVYHELMLSYFENESPELFHTLVSDFERRLTKSERHRMTVYRMQAAKAGVTLPEWGATGCAQVGAYLTGRLADLRLLEIRLHRSKNKQHYEVSLSEDAEVLIEDIKEHVAANTPYFLPCVEPPRDWTTYSDGGFHTREMRRMQPYAIKSRGGREVLAQADLTKPLAAINALQRVPWRVNKRILSAIRTVATSFDTDEVLSNRDHPEPPKPFWLTDDMKAEDMSEGQREEFKLWKRSKAEWHTQRKVRAQKFGRFYTATSIADRFKDFPALYFVYFADFRGRLYAQTSGVSPQGSDMQKALLEFAVGKPLLTEAAQSWFMINGANKWGYDKAALPDRVKWVRERHDLIVGFADDPVANPGWRDADCPFQFLAFCMEYADWQREGDAFLSRLPVGMDGSCNGLQNFSAMLRDEVGGKATNLVPGELPNDIYQMVADVTTRRLSAVEPDDAGYRDAWLKHGITRKLVKRSVMTLPYGSTRFSCAEFIVSDYLKQGLADDVFERQDHDKAARYLAGFVWDSIGDVVVKAREAMAWLQMQARLHVKSGAQVIKWVTPTGFPVVQDYRQQDQYRIRTHLCGSAFIRLNVENAKPDVNRHKNGVAPNFVHSYDAAHLTLVTVEAAARGLDLAMIHDDYGTHAADAQTLFTLIRSEFVRMYQEHDPLGEFEAYPNSEPPPKPGTLDLRVVNSSLYFFS